MTNPLSPYKRLLMAVVGAVLMALHGYFSDDVLTSGEMMQTMLAGLGVITVYALPDTPVFRYMKPAAMAAATVLNILIAANNSGEPYDTELWLNVAIQALTVLGILGVKNDPEPAVPPTADTSAKIVPTQQAA